MLDSLQISKDTALESKDVAKSKLLANLPAWKKPFPPVQRPC